MKSVGHLNTWLEHSSWFPLMGAGIPDIIIPVNRFRKHHLKIDCIKVLKILNILTCIFQRIYIWNLDMGVINGSIVEFSHRFEGIFPRIEMNKGVISDLLDPFNRSFTRHF